jgi:hypothetical protein
MTFIPFLGYYIQRPPKKKELTIEEKRERGFFGLYNRLVGRRSHIAGSFCLPVWYSW